MITELRLTLVSEIISPVLLPVVVLLKLIVGLWVVEAGQVPGAQTTALRLPLNTPPEGYTALFNGNDFNDWTGGATVDPKKIAAPVSTMDTWTISSATTLLVGRS